jgi:tRNA(Ile)-lysidine synthase
LLPLLEKEYNKNIKELLSNMAQSLGYDYDYLTTVAKRTMKQTKLNLNRLKKLHPAIKRLVLRMSIAKLKGDMRRLTFQHIREIEDLLLHRPVNSIVDLPKGVSVVKKKKYLSFYLKD